MDDLNYRKIKNFLNRRSANIGDEYAIRKMLYSLFYYDLYDIPIAILKPEKDINWDRYPYFFKSIPREEIIDIYNKKVKSNCFKELRILGEDELDVYDIKPDVLLEISMKTFRPIYRDNWREESEKINNVEFGKQRSFFAEYLRYYLKTGKFPDLDEFIKYLFKKYQIPIHKDIKIVFENIENSYKDVKEYIKINNISIEEVKKTIRKSTKISNRILMELKS